MFNKDVATGKTPTNKCTSSTRGPVSVANVSNKAPHHPVSECYLWDIFETCTASQTAMIKNGTAIMKDFVMTGYKKADGTSVLY
jgi:hypothetical protein